MTERERLIKELENYEPYAACFSNLTVKGKLLLDILDFLKASEPHELTREEWEAWKKNSGRNPICWVWRDTTIPFWAIIPEDIAETAFLTGDLKLFNSKPDESMIHWEKE